MNDKIRCFYLAREDRKLGYGDNRLVRKGIVHSVDAKPKCCEIGLHGSRTVFDALKYAKSSKLYLVDIWGDVDEQKNKLCGTHREYIAYFNAEKVFRKFARVQALINIEKIKPYCSEADYELILKWLKTGSKNLQARARSAAESAAWSAAYSASLTKSSAQLQEMIIDATGWDIKETNK